MILTKDGNVMAVGAADELFADMSVVILDVAGRLGLSVMELLNTFLDGIQDMGIDITEGIEIDEDGKGLKRDGTEDERNKEEMEGLGKEGHEELHDRKAAYRRSGK